MGKRHPASIIYENPLDELPCVRVTGIFLEEEQIRALSKEIGRRYQDFCYSKSGQYTFQDVSIDGRRLSCYYETRVNHQNPRDPTVIFVPGAAAVSAINIQAEVETTSSAEEFSLSDLEMALAEGGSDQDRLLLQLLQEYKEHLETFACDWRSVLGFFGYVLLKSHVKMPIMSGNSHNFVSALKKTISDCAGDLYEH